MFKKLRQSFIKMNMIVMSLMILLAFAVIYIIIYSNTASNVNSELKMLLELPNVQKNAQRSPDSPPFDNNQPDWRRYPENQEIPSGEDFTMPDDPKNDERTNDGMSRIGFVLVVTEDGYEVEQARDFFKVDELDIETMLDTALDGDDRGEFSLDGNVWTYLKETGSSSDTKLVAFVETSESRSLLINLVTIFIIVFILFLIIIWFISRWFANRSVTPIEQSYNNQRRFVQDASHELKTPVAVMKTNLELLSSHQNESVASQKAWIDNITSETNRMEKLTNELLALARADREQMLGEKIVFSLSDTIQDCILPLEAVLYERKLDFTSNINEDISIYGVKSDIEKLVHILMENAIEYTPEGGIVSFSLVEEKKKAILKVSNSGPGIEKKDLDHIFERFYRADKSRTGGGNSYGLGLSIAKEIVLRHKGKIFAQSVPNEETVFTVILSTA